MKRSTILVVGALLVAAVAWTAYGQAGGGATRGGRGGFGAMGETQQKALAELQEQVAKLKAMSERAAQGSQDRSFQDMSEEERTKMREQMTQRMQEQQQILASMQQNLDRLKGGRQLLLEHNESLKPLQEALASAQKENAKATAKVLEQMVAQRQKQFEDKITAMGMTMEQLQRMGQRRQPQ
ncbi:MAG: hypothetical protein FJ280_03270 [Planctomycetes bacterium]|nr:hypothetical protein [Planctomycetota bacterium]